MFDCHLFDELKADTVRGLAEEWKRFQKGGDEYSERYGPAYLCPVTVMDGDKELRRVGKMVFREEELPEFIKALEADPDVPRLLALRR
jgi:hypothetical protein